MILYSDQTATVRAVIERDGVCFSKREYVQKKYQESAPVFLHNYDWFVRRAKELVPLPSGAEYPYWAFADLYKIECDRKLEALKLEVPADQAVFFDAEDWTKIMSYSYLSRDPSEETEFREELKLRGLNTFTVISSPFYPELKARLVGSWDRLFEHHERILAGDLSGVGSVQAALWCIRREWILPR